MNVFSIVPEVDDINRFSDVKNFYSYARLTPSARNYAGKSKQPSSKDGNIYLKVVFSDAAVHSLQYYPVIRKYNNSILRKKNKYIPRTIVAKEIAKIVYHVLKRKEKFNNKFKNRDLENTKSLQCHEL